MRNSIAFLSLLFLSLSGIAQPVEYYLSNSLRFIDSNNDTVPYPFIGGFVAPQFNEIDLNNDNVKDLVVFDRSGDKLMTFLNKGYPGQSSYIYTPQYEYLFPKINSWMLLRDYNCDGKEDIFCSAVGGIVLYKNTSSGSSLQFTHVSDMLADSTGDYLYVFNEDIPVIDDMDGDGDLDILSYSVGGTIVSYYLNKRAEKGYSCDSLFFKWVDWCWGTFAEGNNSDTLFLANDVNCSGGKYYGKKALHVGSTLLSFDNDEDGDKELLMGDVDYPDLKLLVNGKVEHSMSWDTVISYTKNFPANTKGVHIQKFPAAFYLDLNNDGKKDLIASANESAEASNLHQNWLYRNDGKNNKPNFQFIDSSFLQDKTLDHGSGTHPALFDADGDGDMDLVVSHRGNYIQTQNLQDRLVLYENIGTASQAVFKLKDENYLNITADNLEGIYPTFADLSGDGLADLVMGLHNGKLRYYTNTGTQTSPLFTLTTDTLGGIDVGTSSAPHFYDVNGDSALDLLIGRTEGYFSYYPNKGSKTDPVFADTSDLDSVGNIHVNYWFYNYVFDTSIVPIDSFRSFKAEGHSNTWIGDIDQDGTPEMVCGSHSGRIFVYTMDLSNLADSFTEWTDYFVLPHNGHRSVADHGALTSVAMMDADGDGRPDMFIGNSRGGLHYLNSRYTPLDTLISTGLTLPSLGLVLYPNPGSKTVTLKPESALSGNLEIELVDVFGRNLGSWTWDPLTENEKSLDVNGVASGTYFLRVTHPDYRQEVLRLSVIH